MNRTILLGHKKGRVGPVPEYCRESSETHDRSALHPGSASGKNLLRILDMEAKEFDETFDRLNLVDLPNWDAILERKIIFLGREVGSIAFHSTQPFFTILSNKALLIPHPSGLVRDWNDPMTVYRARNRVETFLSL